MNILLLIIVLVPASVSINILYDNTTLDISLTNTLPLTVTNSTADRCKKIVAQSTALYSLSSEGIFQDYLMSSYSTTVLVIPQNATSHGEDIAISSTQAGLLILNNKNGTVTTFLFNSQKVPSYFTGFSYLTSTSNQQAAQVSVKGLTQYYFLRQLTGGDLIYLNTLGYITSHQLASVNATYYLSPDQKYLALCQPNNYVFLYDFSTFQQLHVFTPYNSAPTFTTNRITFDSASTLMIIETDSFNPVIIVSLSTYLIVNSFSYPHTIRWATFFSQSNNFVLVTADDAAHIFDVRTSLLHDVTGLVNPSSVFDTDFSDSLLVCKDNTISIYSFNYGVLNSTLIVNPSTSNLTNSTSSNNSTSQLPIIDPATLNSTNQTSSENNSTNQEQTLDQTVIDDSQFYYKLDLTEGEKTASDNLGSGISLTIDGTQNLALIISSSPFLIYFLGFINFLNICSMYVLLDMTLPYELYFYLKTIFNFINKDIFSVVGLTINIPHYSKELVTSERARYFSVSSDVISSYYSLFLLILVNYLLVFIFHLIVTKVNKTSMVGKFISNNKWVLLCSQLVNSLIPAVLPWSFVQLQPGFSNIYSKANFAIYCFLFFAALTFLFLYLLNHAKAHKQQILRQKAKKAIVKQIQITKTMKITIVKEDRVKKPLALNRILSINIMGAEWFPCLANFVYPSLILLGSLAYFMVGVLIFTFLNILVFLCDFKNHKNDFFLSLYPFIFHLCFIIFWISPENKILIYTTLGCLFSLLFGLLHFSATTVVKIIYVAYKIIKSTCFKNKVDPKKPLQNKLAKQSINKLVNTIIKKKGKSFSPKKIKNSNSKEEKVEKKVEKKNEKKTEKKVGFTSRFAPKGTKKEKSKIKREKSAPKNQIVIN